MKYKKETEFPDFSLTLTIFPDFSLILKNVRFPLSARKKEFGKKALTRKPLTTTTTCVRRRVLIALLALRHTFRIFRQKMHFKILNKTYEI